MSGGAVTFSVRHPTGAEDAIWDAVEQAILAGMSPEEFKREAAQAWEEVLAADAKRAVAILSK
jgi:hypothetical protein